MSKLREKIINEHIEKHYPNSNIVNHDDPDCDLKFYGIDELSAIDGDWFPLCCRKDPKTGKLVFGGRKGVHHTYTEGETGSGKTTRFVMQSLMALSSLKAKPSFLIVDIHGEIIENMYTHFKDMGYNIKILNCDNPERSDTYNPFAQLALDCLATRSIGNETINKIRRIAEIMQPVESSHDPVWDRGARAYTNGCIIDKFEDLINGDIPPECLTIYNIIQNHYWLRKALTNNYSLANLLELSHYHKKGTEALSVQKMIGVTNNAERTRASYYGVIENHYDMFGQPSMYQLSSSNNISIEDFVNTPTVIVIQSGNTKIGDDLISLLVNDIYTYAVKAGKASATKRLPRNIHCFLDEFANCNIADGPEYIKMLTTSRKFGMFWHMILQCDAQLDRKYDANIGRIIRANSTEIFMGSHDYETSVRFAKSCGQKTIESLASIVAQQNPGLETVDLMTADKLSLTDEGYIYVKSNRHPLLKTYFEAFYNCDEFVPLDDIDLVYPVNDHDYRGTAFTPNDIPPEISDVEVKILEFIGEREVTMSELISEFPDYNISKLANSMDKKKVIDISIFDRIKRTVTPAQLKLYEHRLKNGLCETCCEFVTDPHMSPSFSSSSIRNIGTLDAPKPTVDYDDDPFFRDPDPDDPLYIDMKEHLEITPPDNPSEVLSKFTMIPEFLHDAVIAICNGSDDVSFLCDFPASTAVYKFEIMETFITNHNYSTKTTWEKKMNEEYNKLMRENLFPESIMQHFRKAIKEFKELTLSNIKEIKKLINDN